MLGPMTYGVLSIPSGAAPSSLLTDLVAYWNLGEASGTRADSVGSNDLSDNNTVTQAVGKQGNAAQFTAANSEYLLSADNADLSMGDIDYTLACWVYLDDKSAGRCFIEKYQSGPSRGEYTLRYEQVSNRFLFRVASTSAATIGEIKADSLGSPAINTWYFIVAWHDSVANTVSIQVNNGTVDSAATTGTPIDTTARFSIGISSWDLTAIPMDGRIDEAGIWKRTLTGAERTELYNGGDGITYPF